MLKHFLVAIDDSDASGNALRIAARLALGVEAKVTVLRVIPLARKGPSEQDELLRLKDWLKSTYAVDQDAPTFTPAVIGGIPQVEISRYAESIGVDLVVLGRKVRSRTTRLMLGDTTDAVVRRNRLPTLLVPALLQDVRGMLVALDGTDRGSLVLSKA
ncbi:MAG: universal stress protein, partial [Gemmatimonadota bacterium]